MPSTYATSPGPVVPCFASTLFERLASSFPDPIAMQSSTQNPAAAKWLLAQEVLTQIVGYVAAAVNPSACEHSAPHYTFFQLVPTCKGPS